MLLCLFTAVYRCHRMWFNRCHAQVATQAWATNLRCLKSATVEKLSRREALEKGFHRAACEVPCMMENGAGKHVIKVLRVFRAHRVRSTHGQSHARSPKNGAAVSARFIREVNSSQSFVRRILFWRTTVGLILRHSRAGARQPLISLIPLHVCDAGGYYFGN